MATMPRGSKVRPSTLGKNLLRLRKRAGMSQRALAERSGVHFTAIARLESGARQSADNSTTERLSRALGVRMRELVEPENGGRVTSEQLEAAIAELLSDATLMQLVQPADEDLRWLRSVTGAFWLDCPPSGETVALLIQAHRKRRE